MRFMVLLMLVTTLAELSAQDQQDVFKEALYLKVDNDAFLAQTIDRYYSSGIFLQFRNLAPEGSFPARLMKNKAKTIQFFQFGHVFYTAQDLRLRTIDQLDRPYAGYMSLAYGVDYYFSNTSFIKLEVEGGILGPSAKMAQFQKWYHKIIDARVPRGWRYQIEDSPLLQLRSVYSKLILERENFELYSESSVRMGTIFDNIRQGVSMRWGKFLPMSESSFKLAKLGVVDRVNKDKASYRESYFFASGQIEFVAYNATVQGNFIGKQSIHTESVQRVRYLVKYGWMFGFHKWDLAIAGNNMRRETRESQDHYFITFDIVRRL